MSKLPVFRTTLLRHHSTRQRIIIGVVWLPVLIIFVIALQLRSNYERGLFAFLLWIISCVSAMVLTHKIGEEPRGKFYKEISLPESVRGEFSLGRDWRPWFFMAGFYIVLLALRLDTSTLIRFFLIVAGLALLIVANYLALNGIFNKVIALRVDDEGHIFFRRRNQDWQPLIITDYVRISCEIGVSGQSRYTVPIKIIFFTTNSKKPALSIPISYVRSKRYDSLVPSEVMSNFFKEKCMEHHYDFNDRPIAWVATRHK